MMNPMMMQNMMMMMGMMNQQGMGMKGGAKDGMQPGDWLCPACGDHQFARNTQCRKCGAAKPADGGGGGGAGGMQTMYGGGARMGGGGGGPNSFQPGDWMCAKCGDHQFAR